MKKMLKRISTIVLALIVTLSNLVGVKAFDSSNITIDNSIVIPKDINGNFDNYIELMGNLKNNSAVVNFQYITITQELFEQIDTKSDSNTTYFEEQYKIIEEKTTALEAEKAKVEALKEIAEKTGATQEQIDAYNTAKEAYTKNVNLKETYENNVINNVEKNNKALENLIPGFNNNNWEKTTLSNTTTNSNDYKLASPGNREYYVLWVKVSLNGQDYYQYSLDCNKEEPETYICEYKNGKYYNKQGEEVTEAEYKADCEEKKICKIENGKYYNKQGKEVTEAEYKADCEEPELYVCEINDGKYYNSKGKEVTKEEYKADCEKVVINVCKIVDGKYYDNNGKEVSKKEYEKACTVPSNPKTGLNNNILYGVLITLVAGSSYIVVRKAKKFSR